MSNQLRPQNYNGKGYNLSLVRCLIGGWCNWCKGRVESQERICPFLLLFYKGSRHVMAVPLVERQSSSPWLMHSNNHSFIPSHFSDLDQSCYALHSTAHHILHLGETHFASHFAQLVPSEDISTPHFGNRRNKTKQNETKDKHACHNTWYFGTLLLVIIIS